MIVPADGADRKRLQENSKKEDSKGGGRAEGGATAKDGTTSTSATSNSSAAKSKTDAGEGAKRLVLL